MSTEPNVTGFESAFVDSWDGWDEIATSTFQFYDCKVKPELGLDPNTLYDMCVDLENMIVEFYLDGETVLRHNIKLVIV